MSLKIPASRPFLSVLNRLTAAVAVLCATVFCGCSTFEGEVSTGQCFIDFNVSVSDIFVGPDGVMHTPLPDGTVVPDSASLTMTDMSTGVSHTWTRLSSFDRLEGYRAGRYRVELNLDMTGYSLGVDTIVDLVSGGVNRLVLNLRPTSAWITSNSVSSSDIYTLDGLVAHSVGSGTYAVLDDNSGFIVPGQVEFIASVSRNDGKSVYIVMDTPVSMTAGHYYPVEAVLDGQTLTLGRTGAESYSMTITDAYFDSPAPTITGHGFDEDTPVTATEGVTLTTPVSMTVKAAVPLSHVYLSVSSPVLALVGLSNTSSEVDLFNLTDEQKKLMEGSYMEVTCNSDRTLLTITFTRMIEELASLTSARSTFILWTVDRLNRASLPLSLAVDTRTVAFDVVEVSPAILGDNMATVKLRPSLTGIEAADLRFVTADGSAVCPVHSFVTDADGSIVVTIGVPAGSKPVAVNVEYMGLVRTSFTVERKMPDFTLEPDAFATTARIRIVTDSRNITTDLARNLLFFNNGNRCTVLSRDTISGIVTVTGLKPATSYTLTAGITDHSDLRKVSFTTEAALEVPNGDFEDAVPSMFKYNDLLCGGRYAISPFDIPNRQNRVTYDFPWFKEDWASVNGRTFCRAAKRHNTWYMQPSAQVVYEAKSGSKSVCITSVGWDLDGEAIADYVPESATPTPTYSLVVPNVAHRSAGRLFLGKYTFDPDNMTEIIDEGVPFKSRPSSLNGFYKYQPDQTVGDDRGSVRVTLVNRKDGHDTVIAVGTGLFVPSPDFTTFNVPLEYIETNLKPTHLKIMFLSSYRGDDMPIDDINVPVTALPDRGAMHGSSLWIDNLSFTY